MALDATNEDALGSILEDEIAKGFRVKELPADLRAQMQAYGLTPFAKFRLIRLNPSRRRKLNEAVQRAYHRDLQTPEILSNEQILKLVVQRGEWGPEKDARVKELQRSTNAAMSALYLDGFAQDTSKWATEIIEQSETFRKLVAAAELDDEKRAKVLAVFDRWIAYVPDRKDEYTERFAKPEGREVYSPSRDATFLCDAIEGLEATQAITEIEDLLDKVNQFVKLTEERAELGELQMKHARIFADSVESRRENAEEMARLYFTAERVDAAGKPCGPLVPTFDELWELPDDVIQFLLVESYFFHNGIVDETRPYLETWGYIRGNAEQAHEEEKPSSESGPSDESPEAATSSPDVTPATGTP